MQEYLVPNTASGEISLSKKENANIQEVLQNKISRRGS
jgi:hypothetical protein